MEIHTDDSGIPPSSMTKKLKQQQDAPICDIEASPSMASLMDNSEHLKCSTSGSSNNVNSSDSDLSYHDDIVDDSVDNVSDYDDNDVSDYGLVNDDDDYLTIQSQFGNVDLPPGVEAPVSWLKDASNHLNASSVTNTSSEPALSENKGKANLAEHEEIGVNITTSNLSENMAAAVGTSCSAITDSRAEEASESDASQRFKNFKQFDVVGDFSDHHFSRMGFPEHQPPKSWAKKIQDEWKILERNLPDTIYVRVYESRMELLRAVIVGPSGTPYHDGLFVFDCLFPTKYPHEPPMVYYYSGGLRLNPNLYDCGKVCLSLLGTWSGDKNEKWLPDVSTMLQVLVSIQALILNAEPFYNEPGFEKRFSGPVGDMESNKYSENAFIMSLKTMMYTLRRPPKHFEDFVIGHFQDRAHDILVACKAYVDGARVGSFVVNNGVAEVANVEKSATTEFRADVRKMINILIKNFAQFGSIDCKQFLVGD